MTVPGETGDHMGLENFLLVARVAEMPRVHPHEIGEIGAVGVVADDAQSRVRGTVLVLLRFPAVHRFRMAFGTGLLIALQGAGPFDGRFPLMTRGACPGSSRTMDEPVIGQHLPMATDAGGLPQR